MSCSSDRSPVDHAASTSLGAARVCVMPTARVSVVILGLAVLSSLPALAQQVPSDLDIIDCHPHFYDPTRPEGVPWPGKDTPLYRTVLPKHLRAVEAFRPVTGTVIVEASPRVEDNAWLLSLGKDDPFVVGIVGNLDPGSPTFTRDLERFAADPLFRGIRIPDRVITKLLDGDTLAELQLLADRDLTLDVNGSGAVVARLATRLPKLRIVLNHAGHATGTPSAPAAAWRESIRAAAAHPNVFCKVSHLVRTAALAEKVEGMSDVDFYRPYLDVLWESFGPDRIIFASNWPLSDSMADYKTLQRIPILYALEKGEDAVRKFCSLNSQRAYRWIERPGRRVTR